MEDGEECSSNESGWTKYIDPTSDYDDQNNYNRGFVHDDDDVDEEDAHQHQHQRRHHGYNRRQRQYEDDDDSTASDASSGPGHHHHGEEEEEEDDDDHGNKFFKGKKSSKVVKGRKTEQYEGKGKEDMTLKMKKSTGYGLKQGQGQKPI